MYLHINIQFVGMYVTVHGEANYHRFYDRSPKKIVCNWILKPNEWQQLSDAGFLYTVNLASFMKDIRAKIKKNPNHDKSMNKQLLEVYKTLLYLYPTRSMQKVHYMTII